MSDIIIRQYDPSDLDRCRDLWTELVQHHRSIYNDLSIGGDDPGLYFDKHLARLGAKCIWVAEFNGEVTGLAGLIADGQEAEIDPVVVMSKHRGKGIGRALLNRMIEEAKKLGMRYLNVKPVARNSDAISFYYKAGFRTIGHVELFMDLQQSEPNQWKSGIELFRHTFRY